MNSFSKRLFTAIIFVSVMLLGILVNKYTFIILIHLIASLCLWEFYTLVFSNKTIELSKKILGILAGLMPIVMICFIQLTETTSSLLTYLSFIPFIFMLFLFELFTPDSSGKPFANLAYQMLGFIYIGVPLSILALYALNDGTYHKYVVLGLVLLTWVNDTGAYLVGSQIGRTPLLARISPKKTWEGTIGGVVITLLIGYAIFRVFNTLSLTEWLILAVIVAVFGSLGDLVESMLKRSFKVKDSGSLLPGHGGFLDRYDGFLFMLPFTCIYLLFFT